MKTVLVPSIVALALTLPATALAVDCTEDIITLRSQAEVDAFQETYGPCDTVTENLRIEGEDIQNLAGLAGVEHVGLSLTVRGNPLLTDLVGLEGLLTFGSELVITGNPALETIRALDGTGTLSPLGNGLTIAGNDSLVSLEGLENISRVHVLAVVANDTLTDLRGLDGLNEVTGLIDVQSNANLLSLAGLQNVQGEVGTLRVYNNAELRSLQALDRVHTIGWLNIIMNPLLTRLDGLRSVTTAAPSGLRIVDNPRLESIEELASLQSTNDLIIADNADLTSLRGLENVINVDDDLVIGGSPDLADCSAIVRLVDMIDHGAPGPGTGRPPDVGGVVRILNNAAGCNGLHEVSPLPPAEILLTGSWYDPASAGEGLMIHAVTEDVAVAYFYGYDDQGQRFWLIAVHEGAMGWSKPIDFQANIVRGGDFVNFDPTQVEERPWGTLTFSPRHCDAADIELKGPLGDKMLSAVRLGRVAGSYCADQPTADGLDGLTGSWYDASTPGQGFAVHKIDGSRGVVYYYGFDAQGAPLWLIGPWTEPVLPGVERDVVMYQVSGGTYAEVDPESIVEEPWGTMTLRMDDCQSGHAELNGLDGFQAMNLSLLAPSLGLDCQDPP